MKLLSAKQTRAWDEWTIRNEAISSQDLMERAANACTNWLTEHFPPSTPVFIFCGTGNNGGDGLAIARLLSEKNYTTHVFLSSSERGSDDHHTNLERLKKTGLLPVVLTSPENFPEIPTHSVVLDALFGSGLNRPLDGWNATLVAKINLLQTTIVSIDIPSGMLMDGPTDEDTPCIKATNTLSFQVTKLPFLLPDNQELTGEVSILDIGLDEGFPGLDEARFQITEPSAVRTSLPPRNNFSHKGTYGHALLVAGSPGMMGAALLSARACARSGVGKLTIMSHWEERQILQTGLPEAMVKALSAENIAGWISTGNIQSIGIGPGWGTATEQVFFFEKILKQYTQPIVIDADALNILSTNNYLWYQIPPGSILTPHPGEFARLAGKPENGFQAIEQALDLADTYNIYIILKGRYSFIATPSGKGYFNPTGNPGMATGGSGDVLTGLLAGLLAQGISPLQTCLAGTYLHGLAGDIAAQRLNPISMKASDIIDHLPEAFSTVSTGY